MPIDRGTVVTLEYELKNGDGEPLEDEGAQLEYLHGGFGGIFPKVEKSLSFSSMTASIGTLQNRAILARSSRERMLFISRSEDCLG